jgi:hypothetical protein
VGARALFAFQVGARDQDGEPTDDAELGALMRWLEWNANVKLAEGFYDVFRDK